MPFSRPGSSVPHSSKPWIRTSVSDLELKKLLYDEQQRQIEDDIVPPGIFSKPALEPDVYVEDGDVWTVVGETKVY